MPPVVIPLIQKPILNNWLCCDLSSFVGVVMNKSGVVWCSERLVINLHIQFSKVLSNFSKIHNLINIKWPAPCVTVGAEAPLAQALSLHCTGAENYYLHLLLIVHLIYLFTFIKFVDCHDTKVL